MKEPADFRGKVAVLIPAAGMSTRMGSASRKPFLLLDGVPILILTLRKFAAIPAVKSIFVALRPEDFPAFRPFLAKEKFSQPVELVEGGKNRQQSVENCLRQVPADTDLVAVHDAVRPFVERSSILRILDEAGRSGAAILGLPPVDTVKQVERTQIRATIPRDLVVLAQTPQVFRLSVLQQAYAKAAEVGFVGTDEASLVEHLGAPISVVLGSDRNIKITKPSDLDLARLFQAEEKAQAGA